MWRLHRLPPRFAARCCTKILKTFFDKNQYEYISDNAHWFEPAPAPKAIEYAPKKHTELPKLFLYGRPHVHRNLFFDAIKAIDIAFSDPRMHGQKWEIFCAGSADVPNIRLHSGLTIKNLGKMELDAYYTWARTVDVAVSPMLAPHPNYPTLELASLGSMVVSTKWKTKQDLSFYSRNILMADPTAEDMAEKIILATQTSAAVRKNNIAKNNINTDWPTALQAPIDAVAQSLDQ